MRASTARGAALCTGLLIVGAAALFGVIQQGKAGGTRVPDAVTAQEPGAGAGGGQVPDSILAAGRAVYDAEGCAACHSIAGRGSPRSPLDGVGSRLDADRIRLWIVNPQGARPGIRKPAYSDLPEQEIQALVAYLQSLVAP